MESLPKVPLSACFIAKNEADRLPAALMAVSSLCDDVVVIVDTSTTDNTAEVAAAAGARVLTRAWTGFGEQKRFAEQSAKNDWILSLDADEVASAELVAELRGMFANGKPPLNFYRMKWAEVYPGRAEPRLWAETGNFVRLFNRTFGMTSPSAVHDRVEVPAGQPIGQLRHVARHYTMRSLKHLREKYDFYTTLQAKTLKKKSRGLLAVRFVTEFPMAFIKYYLGHRHFTGGLMGLQVAVIKSHARWARIRKMWSAR